MLSGLLELHPTIGVTLDPRNALSKSARRPETARRTVSYSMAEGSMSRIICLHRALRAAPECC